MGEFVGARIVPRHCGAWNQNESYEMLSIVYQPETGDSYISRQNVPAGTALNSKTHWALCSVFNQQLHGMEIELEQTEQRISTGLEEGERRIRSNLSETENRIRENLSQTEENVSQNLQQTQESIRAETTEHEERLNKRVTEASDEMERCRKELSDTASTLNARMDSIVGGQTEDTEILDARVDNAGNTHDTLGTAIRQMDKRLSGRADWSESVHHQLLDDATGYEVTELTFASTTYSFINLDGTIGTLVRESDSCWHTSDMIPVTPGHVYIVTGSSGWDKLYYAFYDMDEKVLAGEIAPSDQSARIVDKVVVAPPQSVTMRITWIQGTDFIGRVREVNCFYFPSNALHGEPETRVATLESEMDKAQDDLLAAATGEQNTLLSAAVAECEPLEFTYVANRCINERAGEIVPLATPNNNFRVSDPIEVMPGELYAFTVSGGWSKYLYAFYDENDVVVGGFQEKTDSVVIYRDRISPVPARAATVRIAWIESSSFTGAIKRVSRISYPSAELVGAAAEHAAKQDHQLACLEQYLANRVVDEDYEYAAGELIKVTENTAALLIPTTGKKVSEPTGNTNCCVTDQLSIKPYTPYRISAAAKAGYSLYAFYDKNGDLLGGETNTGTAERKIENRIVTSPARATSIRLSCIKGVQECAIQEMSRGYFIGMKPKWAGRTWACIGDSLTENNSRTTKHYFDYIAEKTGIRVINLGISGTGYMNRQDVNRAFYQRVDEIPENVDVITIFGSGNDLSHTLGEVTDAGTDTLCGCMNATIDAIYDRIPLAKLGIVTPTPWIGSTPARPGNNMEKYSEAITAICRRRSIPCLDLYHESGLRPDDEQFRKLAFSKDDGNGVHPDEKGHEIIAAAFYSLLEKLIL